MKGKIAMKPGDLVILKGWPIYPGLDTLTGEFFSIPCNSIGVYVGQTDKNGKYAGDVVFTHGKIVSCAKKIWWPLY